MAHSSYKRGCVLWIRNQYVNDLTNWISFRIPGTVWKYAVLNAIQLNGPAFCCAFGAAGFGGGALFRSTVTTVSDIIIDLIQNKKSQQFRLLLSSQLKTVQLILFNFFLFNNFTQKRPNFEMECRLFFSISRFSFISN